MCDLRQAPTPPAGPLVPPSAAGPSPTFRPSRDGSPVEYVIITNAAMAPAFQALADWKTQKGVQAEVRTLEWVAATYPPGVDRAEQLRFFLADAYANWGTLWVLLGGDSDVIPVRYATHALGLPPELDPDRPLLRRARWQLEPGWGCAVRRGPSARPARRRGCRRSRARAHGGTRHGLDTRCKRRSSSTR